MVDYCRMGTEFQFRKILEKAWVGRPVLSSVDTNPSCSHAHAGVHPCVYNKEEDPLLDSRPPESWRKAAP